jgi:hypothetical protein
MSRRYAGLAVLCLYALVALADTAAHLRQPIKYGLGRLAPERVIVATDAGLFWPADLVAAALLSQG